ncbi:glycosyltransferase [Parapedobacter tibetensis]|uniref:glycosyltransferase n=1 Tax=Parapedobacter tibetensis TaxID=2972951 RepID=UPI00214DC418|nr:glycosyltransferase [Parapedobacter tibetensis]
MVSNKIIQGLWIGEKLTPLCLLCMKSYLFHGHEFHLYAYNQFDLPEGAILKDANEILSKEKIFKDKYGSYAIFSDWFRFELLYKYGGWWSDMDSICLKPFDSDDDYVFATELSGINNCVIQIGNIKVPVGSKVIKDCLEIIYKKGPLAVTNWFEIGAQLLSIKISENKLEEYVCDPNVFTPISVSTSEILFQNAYIEFSDLTYAVHFYNNKLRSAGVDLEEKFHPHSLYERLKAKYLTNPNSLY